MNQNVPAVVMSALLHSVTGEQAKQIDRDLPQDLNVDIDAVVRIKGTLKKGQDTTMMPTPFISPAMFVFAIMDGSGCSPKQAIQKVRGILSRYEKATSGIEAIKAESKRAGRNEPNAAEKRSIDEIMESIFGMANSEMNNNLRTIFGIEPSPVMGRVSAKVTLETVESLDIGDRRF